MKKQPIAFLKAALPMLVAFVALLAWPNSARGLEAVYIYKATVTLPVVRIHDVNGVNKVETKTLTTKDIVNIIQGRKLGSTVDPLREILALSTPEQPDQPGAPTPKLLLYNLDDHTSKVLGTLSTFGIAYAEPNNTGKGAGFGSAALGDSGSSTVAKFYATTLQGGAMASGSSASNSAADYNPRVAGTMTSLSGKMQFDYTDSKGNPFSFTGFVLNGKLTVSGKTIAIGQE